MLTEELQKCEILIPSHTVASKCSWHTLSVGTNASNESGRPQNWRRN